MKARIEAHPQQNCQGEVAFRHPTVFDQISIERRAVELANLNRPEGSPKLTLADYDLRGYNLIVAFATLEHVIASAPEGFYSKDEKGMPVLNLGGLDAYDLTEDDGLIWTLYSAFLEHRRRFRQQRGARDQTTVQQPSGEMGGDHGAPDGPRPT